MTRVHCEPPVTESALHDALAAVLRPVDVVGVYGPDEYEVLLVDVAPDAAEALAARLGTERAQRGVRARIAVACWVRDGRDAATLVTRSCAAVRPTPAGHAAAASPSVIVADPSMQSLYRMLERVAAGTISVLLLGETGVGKEVLAEAVHRMSPRAAHPLVRLNCAALSESLLESELFGHEKGAFTSAVGAKPDLLETADGGTVFLDEIGELPMALQAKLLRVIAERKVLRVGGLKPRAIDVRFVAATNRDLEAEIAAKRFREDLYYRLNGITLMVPPLRERPAEIALLAREFAIAASRAMGRSPASVAPDAMAPLEAYSWPGNIRELKNVMERAVLLCSGPLIHAEHLPLEKMSAPQLSAPHQSAPPPAALAVAMPGTPLIPAMAAMSATTPAEGVARLQEEIVRLQRTRIIAALEKCAGNQTDAAQLLGVCRRTLLNWLDEYEVVVPALRQTDLTGMNSEHRS